MKNTGHQTMKASGILRVNASLSSQKDRIAFAKRFIQKNPELITLPDSQARNQTGNHFQSSDLYQTLRENSLDHSKLSSNKSAPKQEDLNQSLIDNIWDHLQSWVHKSINKKIDHPCEIQTVDHLVAEHGAAGIFWHGNQKCYIQIDKSVLTDTPYFLVVLVHEYMHYIHYTMVPERAYYDCPLVFTEGFAEHASRLFHLESDYPLPVDMLKSWNPNYELGRLLVKQICEEGFHISGFVDSFLMNMRKDNPWGELDRLFA